VFLRYRKKKTQLVIGGLTLEFKPLRFASSNPEVLRRLKNKTAAKKNKRRNNRILEFKSITQPVSK